MSEQFAVAHNMLAGPHSNLRADKIDCFINSLKNRLQFARATKAMKATIRGTYCTVLSCLAKHKVYKNNIAVRQVCSQTLKNKASESARVRF
jgi:hypothetical protein